MLHIEDSEQISGAFRILEPRVTTEPRKLVYLISVDLTKISIFVTPLYHFAGGYHSSTKKERK